MTPRNETTPKFRTALAAVAVPALLMLVGAGCMKLGDEIGTQMVAPIKVDVEALGKAKGIAEEVNAKTNEENDRMADDLTVGMILTENADVPAGAAVVPGAVGCNDRVAYLKVHRATSTDNVLADALATLFSVKESSHAGYYNALWESKLSVDKIQSLDAITTDVWLKGTVASGGACDNPRIKAQIEATIKRLKPKFRIFLNGKESNYRCLGDMSGECK